MNEHHNTRHPKITIDSALIAQEHLMLDGSVVSELDVRLADGHHGKVAVGERAVDGKTRELWVLVGRWGDRHEVTRRFVASAEPVRTRKPRWGEGRPVRSARRLAAVAWLVDHHPNILMTESSQYYELTSADRRERHNRDHRNRSWRLIRAAETWSGTIVAQLQCDWPRERQAERCIEDERDNYVVEIGSKWGKLVIRDHRLNRQDDHSIDDKVRDKLAQLLFDSYGYASSYQLSDLLADVDGGMWSPVDARTVYNQLLGSNAPRRETPGHAYMSARASLIDDPGPVKAELVESHDAVPTYSGDAPSRVLLFRVKDGKKTHWLTAMHGFKDRVGYLSTETASSERVVAAPVALDSLTYAEQMKHHAARLWIVPQPDYASPDDEESARRRYAAAVAKDMEQRARNERHHRRFAVLAWAGLADGGLVLRLRARWGQPDPLLADMPRPTEYVINVSPDGHTAFSHGLAGKTSNLYNSDLNPADQRDFVADLKLIRADAMDDKATDEARHRLHYALSTAELGYISPWDADAQFVRLTGACGRHEITATDLWAELGRHRRDVTPESLATAMAPPAATMSVEVADAGSGEPPHHEICAAETQAELPAVPERRRRPGRPAGDRPAMTSTERSRACRARQAIEQPPKSKGKRGRPPKGDAKMTDAERARAYRARKRAAQLNS